MWYFPWRCRTISSIHSFYISSSIWSLVDFISKVLSYQLIYKFSPRPYADVVVCHQHLLAAVRLAVISFTFNYILRHLNKGSWYPLHLVLRNTRFRISADFSSCENWLFWYCVSGSWSKDCSDALVIAIFIVAANTSSGTWVQGSSKANGESSFCCWKEPRISVRISRLVSSRILLLYLKVTKKVFCLQKI